MKNNRNLARLLEEFLKGSPRALAQRRGSILPPEYRQNTAKLPTDEQYIKNFMVHVECSYMYNYYGAPTVHQHKMYLHKKTFVNPLSVGLVRKKTVEINEKGVDKKTVLFQLIKGVNKDKQTVLRYTELQQFIWALSVQETRQYKKFIVYLYKWLLNEKHSFEPQSIQQQLCQQTSELIIKKIYLAHEQGDYELLKNTEEELLTIETLERARNLKRNGKLLEAKQIYEAVYFARMTEEVDRIEALEYICERCKEQYDTKFLEKMIEKIKQGLGLKSHQKTLQRTIIEIHDLKNPLQNIIDLTISQEIPATEPQVKKTPQNFRDMLGQNQESKPLRQKRKKILKSQAIDGTKNG